MSKFLVPKWLKTTLMLLWVFALFFVSLVAHAFAFQHSGFLGILYLLGIIWIVLFAGEWFEQRFISDSAWTMLVGFAVGMIRLLDMIPNQQEYAHWLRILPRSWIALPLILLFTIFVGALTLIAQKTIKAHKANNRVLGRTD